jgi:hypothetical protein
VLCFVAFQFGSYLSTLISQGPRLEFRSIKRGVLSPTCQPGHSLGGDNELIRDG